MAGGLTCWLNSIYTYILRLGAKHFHGKFNPLALNTTNKWAPPPTLLTLLCIATIFHLMWLEITAFYSVSTLSMCWLHYFLHQHKIKTIFSTFLCAFLAILSLDDRSSWRWKLHLDMYKFKIGIWNILPLYIYMRKGQAWSCLNI